MHGDFQAALEEREEKIRRVTSILDRVEVDVDLEHRFSDLRLARVLEDSTFLRRVSSDEKETLQRNCRCTCKDDDWSRVLLLLKSHSGDSKNKSFDLRRFVSDTYFDGWIVLDFTNTETDSEKIQKSHWDALPPGLHSNTYVANSIFSIESCRVYKNSFVSRTFVGSNAVLMNCGQVSASETMESRGSIDITVGAESGGGRSLSLKAESTMMDVCRQLDPSWDTTESLPSPPSLSPSSVPPLKFNVLSQGSMVCETSKIQNVFLHPHSKIEAAYSVTNSTLFENAQITTGSVVSNTLMQWDTVISGNSIISNVLMMEHSHLGPSSIVESTVMGPDSHASAGEIHASVIGPSTNAHHQSLLIGILWPLGRGNVAYGANVGSNHTGRLPDQESTIGEGIFWGLGCVIKFPVDLSLAPYSMIAAGTKLSPQRITMPFSLIVESGSRNEIVPGWVLQHTPYTLARNDKKFATRRKAKRHASYTGWKILRPSTVERCRVARKILRDVEEDSSNLQNVLGIGDCRLTERARDSGIKAYSNAIQMYALRGLLSWLEDLLEKETSDDTTPYVEAILEENILTVQGTHSIADDSSVVKWPVVPWKWDNHFTKEQEWNYQLAVLVEEFPADHHDLQWIRILLNHLSCLEKDLTERIAKCKRRDDTRGADIVPGYSDSHVLADADPVVTDALEKHNRTGQDVEKILTRIGGGL